MSDKIIIFDMDGVLIDSEPSYLEMNKKLFAEFGIEMDDENYKALVGLPSMPMWTMLKKKYDLKNEVSDFMDLEKRRMHEILDSEKISKPVEGIISILKSLKEKNYKLSVASSSAKANINFVLKKLNLNEYFDFIISGEEVVNGKPAPDIFLRVAEKFNMEPKNCFVIEDSANGIRAANLAGMQSIGFSNNESNKQDLSDADLTIKTFDQKNINRIIKFIN
ncbi:MAG: HAD family phosphatase [Bacteroidota bacterium]|nr:HAD family phosphatase [Bacteroidota bacterium]